MLVVACGPRSAEVAAARGVELPVRPLCRQLLSTGALDLPGDLPMIVEAETGFHFRRRGDRLVLAMTDPEPRWGFDELVDESVFGDRLERLAHRYPPAARTTVDDAWAGLYDMTPDAHPIIGWVADGVYAACGFSGHGFMQSPAVGEAAAAELLGDEPPFDLSPYRLERFEATPCSRRPGPLDLSGARHRPCPPEPNALHREDFRFPQDLSGAWHQAGSEGTRLTRTPGRAARGSRPGIVPRPSPRGRRPRSRPGPCRSAHGRATAAPVPPPPRTPRSRSRPSDPSPGRRSRP